MRVSFSVIIPTLGRETLARTLESVKSQMAWRDEVIVVSDGPSDRAREICKSFGKRIHYFEHGPTRSWGHAQRNFGMDHASKTHLAFMDDDDIYLPCALKTMRRTASRNPPGPILFRANICGNVLWEEKIVRMSNVGTPMIVAPTGPGCISRWRRNTETESGGGGDFLFIRDTVALWPENALVWDPEIVCDVQERNFGKTPQALKDAKISG